MESQKISNNSMIKKEVKYENLNEFGFDYMSDKLLYIDVN